MRGISRSKRFRFENQSGQITLDASPALHGLAEKTVHAFRRFFTHPVKVVLVMVGIALVLFSMGAHAFQSDGVQVSASTNTLALQPGSELPIQLYVNVPPYHDAPIPVSFQVNSPPEIIVDGQLHTVETWFSLARTLRIGAHPQAAQGTYLVAINVNTIVNGVSVLHPILLSVQVGPESLITYFTSPNTTLAPSVSHVVFAPAVLDMTRNQNDSFTVSFLHSGSATDYIIRFSEQPIGISARIANATHHLVGDGQVVSAFVEVTTSPLTAAQTFPLHLEAYNVISGERMQLGTVPVTVRPVVNVTADLPFQEYSVERSRVLSTFLTITNTEYGDQDVVIQSSSNSVVPGVHSVNIPSKSSVSVPIQVFASDELGVRSETLYMMNAKLTKSIPLHVRTVPMVVVPVDAALDSNSNGPMLPTGLVSGVLSPLLGILVIILAALLVFSKRFRNFIRKRLPKPAPPAKPVVKPVEVNSEAPAEKPVQ